MLSNPASFAQALTAIEEKLSRYLPGTISRKLRRKPDGSLREEFYYQFYVNGRRKERYIRKNDLPEMLKQFEEKKKLKAHRREMRRFLAALPKEKKRQFQAAISLCRQWNINDAHKEAIRTEQEEASLREFEIRPPAEISSVGLRLRSRVEEMCLSIVLEYGLQVRYEVGIRTREQLMYNLPSYSADFLITLPSSGQNLLWEHLGRLDEPGYLEHQRKKLRDYRREGIIEGRNLIITTSRKHVNKQLILWELIRGGAIDPCEARRHFRRDRRLIR